ncbi:MAG: amidase [Thermoanaerobaculia bacterium]|nr:amidase [Thermoanaerobaculia bacterium]
MFRLLRLVTLVLVVATPLFAAHPPIEEASVGDLQAAMTKGETTSRELVTAYLERIEKIDKAGPRLNAVIELNPDAIAIAEALDAERAKSGPRGPLHGIPVLIKDNIDTADKMETTAGSLALLGSKPSRDAFVVERLRAAGAVILGKTNLSEWANFRSSKSSSGWSGRGGQTRNPHALDRNASGSSSGSGSAVAAGLAPIAVGTETDGSIISPASVCGIVGIKPTIGLVSRSGIVPIAHSQDTAGPMTKSVADAAVLLGALTGIDARDPETKRSDGKAHADYTQFLDANALSGARIGVVKSKSFGLGPKVDPLLESAVAAMKSKGATVVEVELKDLETIGDSEYEVLLYEFKTDLEAYFADRPGSRVKTIAELIAFNKANAAVELPYFGQEILELAEKKGPLTEKAYLDALAKNHEVTRTKGIDAVIDAGKLDALVTIANGPSWPIDLVNGDAYTGGASSPAAVAGYPSITVPAGDVHGLPVGVLFFGKAWSEPRLIAIAYAFEQATKARRAPAFKASVP